MKCTKRRLNDSTAHGYSRWCPARTCGGCCRGTATPTGTWSRLRWTRRSAVRRSGCRALPGRPCFFTTYASMGGGSALLSRAPLATCVSPTVAAALIWLYARPARPTIRLTASDGVPTGATWLAAIPLPRRRRWPSVRRERGGRGRTRPSSVAEAPSAQFRSPRASRGPCRAMGTGSGTRTRCSLAATPARLRRGYSSAMQLQRGDCDNNHAGSVVATRCT